METIGIRICYSKYHKIGKKSGASYTFLFMKPSGKQLDILGQLIEAKIIKPVIDRIVPFTDIEAALTYSKSGQATGKIILQMINDSQNEVTE